MPKHRRYASACQPREPWRPSTSYMQKAPFAEFVASAVVERDFPAEELPEVVLAGRSNVGKSSLINRLARAKGLARTSSTPGKTQSINFYRFNRSFFFVDLPGYGYARTGKDASRQWRRLVEQYFRERPTIALVLQLVDARLAPTVLDNELADWMDHLQLPRLVVATKADKLSGNQAAVQQRVISGTFGTGQVIMSSAVTGAGCKEIWERVVETIQNK
jgi:GTP-binding protein